MPTIRPSQSQLSRPIPSRHYILEYGRPGKQIVRCGTGPKMWNRPKDVEQRKDQQYWYVLYKKMDVAQDVEQPQFVEQPHTVEQPQFVEQPKDVEQAQRCGTKERSAILVMQYRLCLLTCHTVVDACSVQHMTRCPSDRPRGSRRPHLTSKTRGS